MLRNIKRSVKYFIIVFGVILFLPTVLYLLLQTAEVQTFLVKRITNHFSAELKSTISLGSIEYKFFNRLSIKDLIIKDKNNDTLLYSKEITVGIKRIDFKNKSYRLGRLNLIDPVISFITDSTGLMNLTWYLDLLKNHSDTSKKESSTFRIDQIDVRNARFSLINRTAPGGKTGIDFNNLKLSGINAIVEDLNSLNDTTSFNIYKLAFRESGGFTVRNMNSYVILARQNIRFNSTFVRCDSSSFNIPKFALIADSANSFKNFAERVKLDIQIDKSLLNTSDLRYFITSLDSLNESVRVSGKVVGTISELRGRNIKLSYRNFTSLDCDFDFSGLPKIENSYLYIGVNSLKTNAKDLEQIRISGKESLVIPEVIKKLGTISFNGSFTGFTTDFVTYGEIRTSQGNIRTDLSVRPGESKKYMVKGLLKGSNINIGELTGKSEFLGDLSMQANIDGYAYSLKKFAGDLTGKIDSVEINKYLYRNITLSGSFTEKTWDGSINIADKNLKFNLLGLLNFNNKLPEFDFTLNIEGANLYKLNFDKLDTTSTVTMLLTSNFKGNNIDNLDGEIKLINSKFRKYGNDLELYDFSIRTHKENDTPVLSLRTDFVNAYIKGHYNFAGLGHLAKSTLALLMPSEFHTDGKQDILPKNMFTFEINFKNTDKINTFFRTGVLLADKSYIKGSVFADSIINVSGQSDLLTIKNNVFKNFSFNTTVTGSELTIGINSPSLSLMGQSELKDFSVGLKTKPDNFIFKINWDNKDTILNRGNFIARGTVLKNMNGKPNAILKVEIDSSHFYSDNKLWKLTNSSILIDSNAFNINKLFITSADRYYLVNGSVSENPSDTLHLEFKGIDISPLNIWIGRKRNNDPDMIPLNFKGSLNGKVLLTNVYKNLLLVGSVIVDNFSVLGSKFGNISVNSTLDNVNKILNLEASNSLNSVKTFDVSGMYDPASKKINLNARVSKLPIDFLNPLLKVFASEISGSASGKLNLSGTTDNLFLKGAAKAENASMKINFLQTKYSLNDTVRFDREGIKFDNVRITDPEGNVATLGGSVNHKNFKEYAANLIINITSNGFLVLNTQARDNQMFYGTAYASGVAKIRSDQNSLSFDISGKTSKSTRSGKTSKLFVPISKGLSISEYSYISFADSSKGKTLEQTNNIPISPASSKKIGLDLNMNIEVTPDAEIQIIFDAKAGDVMKGHGSSENLNVTLNKKGDFAISGDYVIESGTYNFTLGPIINKPFDVESGGMILFNGNLKDAEIDLKASYLNLKASLASILEDPQLTERIRVEPQLNLSGKLFNPVVGFDIYLPDADEETRTRLKNAISTQEEMTRQVTALLLINNFIASGTSTTTTATSAMAATSFEMISNQVSNMLSQLSKSVDIGLNIRPGSNAISPQEAELALSTQVLNNKVILNTNFDVRGTGYSTTTGTSQLAGNTNQLTGDFDAEIKLTEKLRFKVFNRFNDTYSTSGLSPYTQGVGIQYKQDFNRFSDLFRKKAKADMKKEDETKIKNKQSGINSP